MTQVLLITAWMATAGAAEYDGTWQLTALTTPTGEQTAEELMPEGCTSRELWAFDEGTVRRGHERSCPQDDGAVETCEVWVEAAASEGETLMIPHTVEALGQVDTATLSELTKKGATTTRKVESSQLCSVRLDGATWAVALDGEELVMTLSGGAVTWRLRRAD